MRAREAIEQQQQKRCHQHHVGYHDAETAGV